jgi:hypothetical protein
MRALERWVYRRAVNFLYRLPIREKHCRHEFFYNAFMALRFNGIDGDYLEFGCHGGVTFGLAHDEIRRHKHSAKLWAFDSFQGLPAPSDEKDAHPLWTEGRLSTSVDRFHRICANNGIARDAYTIVPGFFDQTLQGLSASDKPINVALAYIDCDLYSSTKTVLDFLQPRLKHGMIIAFDDYFCWSDSNSSGERLAMLEFLSLHREWNFLPYKSFGWHGQSFIVENSVR